MNALGSRESCSIRVLSPRIEPPERAEAQREITERGLEGRLYVARGGFLEFVLDAFECSGFPPSMACFEITETAAISNLVKAQSLIKALREKGCRIALDDFLV